VWGGHAETTLIMLLDGAINRLPSNVVHISGFGTKDSGVLDFDAMFQFNAMFCYRGCLRGICWWCSLTLISIQHPISPCRLWPICRKHHATLM
jgi:hypothetical protein